MHHHGKKPPSSSAHIIRLPPCLLVVVFCLMIASSAFAGAAETQKVEANRVAEVALLSEKTYANPFLEVELDAVVTRPDGKQLRVPAFWAGDNRWCFRYASDQLGQHAWRSECSDKTNTKLHGIEGKIEVTAYAGDNLLYRHGPIQIAEDRRHFAHTDGTPFLWLGDTWWKGLCKRLTWEGFQELTADRKTKGFNVVQIVCGPYPDENPFEARWENEGGKPYLTRDFSVVNPKYFHYADRRIAHLADAGIVPAIVGSWARPDCDGLQTAGVVGMKRHWRNLIARYGTYPTVWILAGEWTPPQLSQWTEIGKYVRTADPYRHPTTIHAGVVDFIDFTLVGGSHDEAAAITPDVLAGLTTVRATSQKPVLCGETCYEGHMQQGFQYVQRHMFWMYMLSGAAGHTYGAAGVWHASVEGDPGIANVYDFTTWREGMNYPGSTQLGLGKKLLEKYPWWRFEPHPEWVEPGCYAAGIPGEVRLIYLPRRNVYNWIGPMVKNLESDVDWHVCYFDPATGRTFDQGTIQAQAKPGDKTAKPIEFQKNVPSPQDWVLVIERVKP